MSIPQKDDIHIAGLFNYGNGNHTISAEPRPVANHAAVSEAGWEFGSGADNVSVRLSANGQSALEKGYVDLGSGANSFTVTGADGLTGTTALKGGATDAEAALVLGGAGNDKVSISNVAVGLDKAHLALGAGNNIVEISAGTAMKSGSSITAGAGADKVTLTGGVSDAALDLGAGNNTVEINGDFATGSITTGAGADKVTLTGDAGNAVLDLGAGNNTVTVNGDFTTGSITAAGGVDRVSASGVVSGSTISTGDGADSLTLGTVRGGSSIILGNGKNVVSVDSLEGGSTITAGSGGNRLTLGGADGASSVDLGAGNDTLFLQGALGAGVVLDGGAGTTDMLNISGRSMTTLAEIRGEGAIKNFEILDLSDKKASSLYIREADLQGFEVAPAPVAGKVTVVKGLPASLTVAKLTEELGEGDIMRINGDGGKLDTVCFEPGWTKVGTAMGCDIWASNAGDIESSRLVLVQTGLPVLVTADINLTLHTAMGYDASVGAAITGINLLRKEATEGTVTVGLQGPSGKFVDNHDGTWSVLGEPAGGGAPVQFATLTLKADNSLSVKLEPGVHSETSYAALKKDAEAVLKAAQTAETAAVKAYNTALANDTKADDALDAAHTKHDANIAAKQAAFNTAKAAYLDTPNPATLKAMNSAQSALGSAKKPVQTAQDKATATQKALDEATAAKAAAAATLADAQDTLDGINAKTGLIVLTDAEVKAGLDIAYTLTDDNGTKGRSLHLDVADTLTEALTSSSGGNYYSSIGSAAYKITGTGSDERIAIAGTLKTGTNIALAGGKDVLSLDGIMGEGTKKGAVTATVTATGDSTVTAKGMVNAAITVNGGDDTIKITAEAARTDPAVRWSTISLGDGANRLEVAAGAANATAVSASTIKAGNGDNVVTVTGKALGASEMTLTTGNGANSVSVTGVSGMEKSTVTLGVGADTVTVRSTGTATEMRDDINPNNPQTRAFGTSYAMSGGTLNVGNGDNEVTVRAANGVALTGGGVISAGSGNDVITVTATAVNGTAVRGGKINAGEGDNLITVTGQHALIAEETNGKVTSAAAITSGKGDDTITVGPTTMSQGAVSAVGMHYASVTDTGGDNVVKVDLFNIHSGASNGMAMNNSTISLGAGNDRVEVLSGFVDNLHGFRQTSLYGKSTLNVGAGDDTVVIKGNISGLSASAAVSIDLGAGKNSLAVEGDVVRAKINGGADKDVVSIVGDSWGTYGVDSSAFMHVAKMHNVTIALGNGDNELRVGDVDGAAAGAGKWAGSDWFNSSVSLGSGADNVSIVGRLDSSTITDTGGHNTVSIFTHNASETVLTNSSITLGGGNDILSLKAASPSGTAMFGKSALNVGAGNDSVEISGHVLAQSEKSGASINLGAGVNTLSIDGDLGFAPYLVDPDNGIWSQPTAATYATITGGAGADYVAVSGNIIGATINTGAGNDSLSISKSVGAKASLLGGAGVDTLNITGMGEDMAPGEYFLSGSNLVTGAGARIGGFEVLDIGRDDGRKTELTVTGNIGALLGADTAVKYVCNGKTYNEKVVTVVGTPGEDSYRLGGDWSDIGQTVVGGVTYRVLQFMDGKTRMLVDAGLTQIVTSGINDADDLITGADYSNVSITLTEILSKTLGSLTSSSVDLGSGADSLALAGTALMTRFDTGAGNDTLTIAKSSGSIIDLAEGADSLTLGETSRTKINTDAGNDTVSAGRIEDSTVELGQGSNLLEADFAARTTVTAGVGKDTVVLHGADSVTLALGEGDDVVTLEGGARNLSILDESGDNRLELNGGAATGMSAKFAGESVSSSTTGTTTTTVTAQSRYHRAEGDLIEDLSVRFGAGDDTLKTGDGGPALVSGGLINVGGGDNVVALVLQKGAYTEDLRWSTTNKVTTATVSFDRYAEATVLAGSYGAQTNIRFTDDPALLAAGKSYAALQLGAGEDNPALLDGATIHMGNGVNKVTADSVLELRNTTISFGDSSANQVNLGGGVFMDNLVLDFGKAFSDSRGTAKQEIYIQGAADRSNSLTILGAGKGRLTMGGSGDTVNATMVGMDAFVAGDDTLSNFYIAGGAGADSIRLNSTDTGKLANIEVTATGGDTVDIDLRSSVEGSKVAVGGFSGGSVTIQTGAGHDSIILNAASGGRFCAGSFDSGAGNDTVTVNGSNATKGGFQDVTFNLGSGLNAIDLTPPSSATLHDTVSIIGNIANSATASDVGLGNGNDMLTLQDGFYGAGAIISLGAGVDTLTLQGECMFSAGVGITGGAGIDNLNLGGLGVRLDAATRLLSFDAVSQAAFGKISGFERINISAGAPEGENVILRLSGTGTTKFGGGETQVFASLVMTKEGGGTETLSAPKSFITGKAGDSFVLDEGWSVLGTVFYNNTTWRVVAHSADPTTRYCIDSALTMLEHTRVTDAADLAGVTDLNEQQAHLADALSKTFDSINMSTLAMSGSNAAAITVTGATKASVLTAGAGDDTFTLGSLAAASVHMGDGANTLVAGATSQSGIIGGGGDDSVTLGVVAGTSVNLGAGANAFGAASLDGYSTVQAGAGNDTFAITGNMKNSFAFMGDGANSLSVGGTVDGSEITAGTGADTVDVTGDLSNAYVALGNGHNTILVGGKMAYSTLSVGSGNDSIVLSGDVWRSNFTLGSGANTLNVSGDVTYGNITGGSGVDEVSLHDVFDSKIYLANGNNIFETDLFSDSNLSVGTGNDSVMLGDVFTSTVALSNGDNVLSVGGDSEHSAFTLGTGNDSMSFGGLYNSTITLGGGVDTLSINGGLRDAAVAFSANPAHSLQVSIRGSAEDDSLHIGNGNISAAPGSIDMKDGDDLLSLWKVGLGSNLAIDMGSGNDTLILSECFFVDDAPLAVSGGTGLDRLMIGGLGDLTKLQGATGFEHLDFSGKGTDNVSLTLTNILDFGGDSLGAALSFLGMDGSASSINAGKNAFFVSGDAGVDTIGLALSEWSPSLGTHTADGITYDVYQSTTDQDQYLLVQQTLASFH